MTDLTRPPYATLPDWAEAWLPGTCGCGASLVRVEGWGGSRTVCSVSGWETDACPKVSPEMLAAMNHERLNPPVEDEQQGAS